MKKHMSDVLMIVLISLLVKYPIVKHESIIIGSISTLFNKVDFINILDEYNNWLEKIITHINKIDLITIAITLLNRLSIILKISNELLLSKRITVKHITEQIIILIIESILFRFTNILIPLIRINDLSK